jgi:hypothetical protein
MPHWAHWYALATFLQLFLSASMIFAFSAYAAKLVSRVVAAPLHSSSRRMGAALAQKGVCNFLQLFVSFCFILCFVVAICLLKLYLLFEA